jgi:regulation of enolase protein 1 (concanavalin A-like superfamily)
MKTRSSLASDSRGHQPELIRLSFFSGSTLLPGCVWFLMLFSLTSHVGAGEILFRDDFAGKLGEGWAWVREHPRAWRVTPRGLEVLIEPGNMWGPSNDARNVLVRPAPDATNREIEFSVKVQNQPSNQYEQVDLVWYYDDSNMVKLGQELVDGKLSVVMGREEMDKTRTVALIPLESTTFQLRLFVKGGSIRGQYRASDAGEWRNAGQCDLPAPPNVKAKISLQFYQGAAGVEHWARVTEFRVRAVE